MAAELEARLRAMALGDVEAAISGGDVEAVRRWIELGGDVNAKGDGTGHWSLLYEACVHSVGESLVNIDPYTRTYYDTREKNDEARVAIISLLLEHGAAPIHRVCLVGVSRRGSVNLDAIRLLLSHGAGAEIRASAPPRAHGERLDIWHYSWTALHAAARGHDPEVVAMLLDQGRANPNIRVLQVDESWPEGDRLNPPYPLLLAAGNGISSEIVRVLLSRGADINVVNCLGQNAEDHARWALETLEAWDELPHDEELDAWDQQFRLSGEVEKMIDVLVDVRREGSWRRYSNEPRIRLFLLHALCEAKRAFPPPHPCRGFDFESEPLPWGVPLPWWHPEAPRISARGSTAASNTPSLATRLYALPAPLVWNVLTFWASARDPDY